MKEDGDRDESASIGTQKAILTDYVRQRGWHLVQTYVDDGYSGTNFQRPGFQSMIQDIEAKRINCVITKDLSRLGRNYLDCGLYLEVFFPEHGVRYISVNDGVDTLNKSAMDITPFRNILNEMYAADVSMKVKSALRARFNSGLYVSTSPPYGYLKDPADHNHLIIDEKAAPVVKLIFKWRWMGLALARYATTSTPAISSAPPPTPPQSGVRAAMSGTLRARRITATSGATTASGPFYAALCTPETLWGISGWR